MPHSCACRPGGAAPCPLSTLRSRPPWGGASWRACASSASRRCSPHLQVCRASPALFIFSHAPMRMSCAPMRARMLGQLLCRCCSKPAAPPCSPACPLQRASLPEPRRLRPARARGRVPRCPCGPQQQVVPLPRGEGRAGSRRRGPTHADAGAGASPMYLQLPRCIPNLQTPRTASTPGIRHHAAPNVPPRTPPRLAPQAYCCPLLLDPQDPLFARVGGAFVRHLRTAFGDEPPGRRSYYIADRWAQSPQRIAIFAAPRDRCDTLQSWRRIAIFAALRSLHSASLPAGDGALGAATRQPAMCHWRLARRRGAFGSSLDVQAC